MVTSLDDMNSLSNAFVAGATDYVTKPLNRIELVARVRAALKLKQELDRRQAREHELLSFLSSWGDRRAGLWIDEVTGLFVGEVAEAYLTAACGCEDSELISIVALTLDRLDAYRAVNGEIAAQGLRAEVARAVRRLASTVGIVAASYRNGIILLVAPEVGADSVRQLGETLRKTIERLHLRNSESVASDYVTASVVAITGRVKRAVDSMHLLTHALAKLRDVTGAGGDRVLALTI
jgi:PleD family two-component response regulator